MTFPFSRVRHLLIDLDGVLYRGAMPLDGAAEFLDWLRSHRVAFRLVTNNATLTQAQYVDKLAGMRITVTADEVFTSALATARYLRQQGAQGQTAYVLGEDGLKEAVRDAGLILSDRRPQWVVVGLDRALTYNTLATATQALHAGAHFVASNPDTSLPTEAGLAPGAGSIVAALAAASGRAPLVVGKPQPLMLQLAVEDMRAAVESSAMLGDRLDTDIAGANNLHMLSILVLTGVSTRDEIGAGPVSPSLVVDDLAQLMAEWTEALG